MSDKTQPVQCLLPFLNEILKDDFVLLKSEGGSLLLLILSHESSSAFIYFQFQTFFRVSAGVSEVLFVLTSDHPCHLTRMVRSKPEEKTNKAEAKAGSQPPAIFQLFFMK